jgi:hypothetical protein
MAPILGRAGPGHNRAGSRREDRARIPAFLLAIAGLSTAACGSTARKPRLEACLREPG